MAEEKTQEQIENEQAAQEVLDEMARLEAEKESSE
jgi:hypothetical protein